MAASLSIAYSGGAIVYTDFAADTGTKIRVPERQDHLDVGGDQEGHFFRDRACTVGKL